MIEPNRTECGTDMPNCNMVFVAPFSNIDGKESDADISTIYESKVWTRIYYEVNMGIPAYYKKLIRSVPGLVSVHSHAVSWLFMDFNCLIYHCIPVVYEMGVKIEDFESVLITEVVRYTREVVKEVAPSKGVYIAIDGVVPMAKMRQQRLRRFKSVWEKEHAMHANPEMAQAKWDTNAITPGTVFMKNLAAALQAMCDEKGWILSNALEPFEAEHKLTAQWRTGHFKGADIAVYGMDADLIVLSLLGQYQNQLGKIWLFREAPSIDVTVGFEWFSIDLLKGWILQERDYSFILTYCFAMSVLGNDFLPSSLGLKMRDGGHDELLRCLTMPLIDEEYNVIHQNLFELFRIFSVSESQRIVKYVKGKQRMACNAKDINLGENNWPLSRVEYWLLNQDWENNYWKYIDASIPEVCHEYLKGIKWVWNYYIGKPVCFNWFYPHLLPPLFTNLVQMYIDNPENYYIFLQDMSIILTGYDIKPVEQLALVLPLYSWHLIPSDCKEKRFPQFCPQAFPSEFEFESVGNNLFWQCIPLIPCPTPSELKALINI